MGIFRHALHPALRRTASLVLIMLAMLICFTPAAFAQTKSLKLYYLHTGEKDTIVYKRNGKFDPAGLKKINWFLRDWRRNEPTKMDPNLLDLVWEAYRQSGSKDYIHVISGYRSPATNNVLRSRSKGVAKNSQHTYGKALDFFLPDVKLSKLRNIGLKMEVGGVGYYPTSGSPFVHLDTGNVRHWPGISRTELAKVFPDGKTMHVPSDGKPLAKYDQAVADYKKRTAKGELIPETKTATGQLTFFQRLAGLTREDQADDEENNTTPAPRPVTTTKPAAPEVIEPQYAELPKLVPVPVLAPRGQNLDTGADVALAALLPEETAAPEVITPGTEPGTALDAIAEASLADDNTTFASIALPVPERRPDIQPDTQIASLETEPATTSELAMVDPVAPEPDRGAIEIAALTPSEIEDLRRAATPTPVRQPAPTPLASVGPETDTNKAPAPEVDAIAPDLVVASLTPAIEAPAIQSEPVVPVPLPNPVAAPAEIREPEIAVSAPIEPGVKSTGELAIPVPNPVTPAPRIQTAALEAEIASPVLSGFPIPVRNPRADIVVASLETKQAESPGLAKRTISLDANSAPQENSSTIGQWALANTQTIRDLAEVQAPAYGRNIVRNVDTTIIKQGFESMPLVFADNGFTGKAVKAMKFAKLQIR